MITRLVLLPDASASARAAVRYGGRWRWALGVARIRREFPTVEVEISSGPASVPPLEVRDWQGLGFDPYAYDAVFRERRPSAVHVAGPRDGETATVGLQVLTRYQGLVGRRNRASAGPRFDGVLARHRGLHDLSKPLVAADYYHALDTWQWTLRLSPHASLPLQLAALFHDVERLTSEADRRVEHLASNYQDFKNAHARAGAAIAAGHLRAAGITGEDLGQTLFLVEEHELPGADPDLATLGDADALSFLSLSSAGYLDYFGPDATRRKIAYTLRRMRRAAIALLPTARYRADVERVLVSELVELGAELRAGSPPVVQPAAAPAAQVEASATAAVVQGESVAEHRPVPVPGVAPRVSRAATAAAGPVASAEPGPVAGPRLEPAANTDREQTHAGPSPWRERHGGIIGANDLDLVDDALDGLEQTVPPPRRRGSESWPAPARRFDPDVPGRHPGGLARSR